MANAGDRDNFSGDVPFTAPTGGYTKGLIYACTDTYGVARETVSATATGKLAIWGMVWATKNIGTGKSFAIGDKVYVDASTKKATPNATGNTLVGVATRAAGVSDTVALVLLIGMPVTAT